MDLVDCLLTFSLGVSCCLIVVESRSWRVSRRRRILRCVVRAGASGVTNRDLCREAGTPIATTILTCRRLQGLGLLSITRYRDDDGVGLRYHATGHAVKLTDELERPARVFDPYDHLPSTQP